jgi:hypothetical protein
MTISFIIRLLNPGTAYDMKPGHVDTTHVAKCRGDQESLGKTHGADLSPWTTSSYGQDRSVPHTCCFEPLRQAFYFSDADADHLRVSVSASWYHTMKPGDI